METLMHDNIHKDIGKYRNRIAELEDQLRKKDEIINYQDEQLGRKPCQYKRCIEFLKLTEQRDRLAKAARQLLLERDLEPMVSSCMYAWDDLQEALASLDKE